MWDTVVVGAGLAGLTAAQALQQAGQRVLVLEKSQGLGGRLATRRVEGQPLDHGCRYLQPTTPYLHQLLDQLVELKLVHPWQPTSYGLQADGTLIPQNRDTQNQSLPYFVAPEGMTAIAKHLATDLTIWRQHHVNGVNLTPQHHWLIQATTAGGAITPINTARLILALPATQISSLLLPLSYLQSVASLLQTLALVRFDPVITVMAGYSPNAACTPIANRPQTAGWMVQGSPPHPLIWAGLDSSKRSAAACLTIVIHSSATFAQPYLNQADIGPAGPELLSQTAAYLGSWLTQPRWHQVHRWRYGLVQQPLACSHLNLTVPAPLVCCGDWAGGQDAGAALESGLAAANQMP